MKRNNSNLKSNNKLKERKNLFGQDFLNYLLRSGTGTWQEY